MRKTVLITGANRGIGAALAAEATALGHDVIRATRAGKGGDVTFDVTDRSSISQALAAITRPIDILINNAGIFGPARQSTTDMDFDGMAQTFAVNVAGPLAVSAACLPHLRRAKSPRILTISSQMSAMTYAKSDNIAYRASKVAVNKVMQGLATDLRAEGIVVALIDPGWVRTDMGGPGADLDPRTVARGILTLADTLSLSQSGKFFLWSGAERSF